VIKIATSLVVCFLQRQFHDQWQNHGPVFLTKIELRQCVKPKHPCSTAPNSGHYIEKMLLKEPFEALSTWSSNWMVMVNNDREVCLAMNYL
jgi:hypothetical protein